MSSNTPKIGDHVIVYEGYQKASHIILKKGGIFNDRYGSFHHDDFLAAEFGSKVRRTRLHGY